jgi:hypothetical protein
MSHFEGQKYTNLSVDFSGTYQANYRLKNYLKNSPNLSSLRHLQLLKLQIFPHFFHHLIPLINSIFISQLISLSIADHQFTDYPA